MTTKKKTKQEPDVEYITDEEAVRERAMSNTGSVLDKLAIRPLTVTTISQMRRNGFFDSVEEMQQTAMFGFIHSAEKQEVQAVVNSKDEFLAAVDDWMEENFTHHNQMQPLTKVMSSALEEYMAAMSQGESPYKGNGSKN
jgi:hypothetical protein